MSGDYKNNKKESNILENEIFLQFCKEISKKGYEPYISIKELQNLIEIITLWFEFKYPEKYFDYYDGIYPESIEIKNITKYLNIEQLFFRLNENQKKLLNNEYTKKEEQIGVIYDKENLLQKFEKQVSFIIKRKSLIEKTYLQWKTLFNEITIYVNPKTGVIDKNYFSKDLIDKKNIDIKELYNTLKSNDDLDLTEIEESIKNHDFERNLRNIVLECIQLKLLFGENTSIERGYKRAKRFTNEFNKKLNCNLSTDTIDKIINKEPSKKLIR